MDAANSTSMMTKKGADRLGETKFLAPRSLAAPSCDQLVRNYSNFKRSACPARFMFYKNGSWVDYPKEAAELMKTGFVEGKLMIEARFEGFNCLVDFCRMLETDLESGNQRSIAWIDADGKCFFPKVFSSSYDDNDDDLVNCDEEYPKISIDLKLRENLGCSNDLEGLGLSKTVEFGKKMGEGNIGKEQTEGSSSNINANYRKIEVPVKIVENSRNQPTGCLQLNETVRLNKRKREDNIEKETMEVNSYNINTERLKTAGSESRLARWPKSRVMGAEGKGFTVVRNLFLSGLGIMEPRVRVTAVHQSVRVGPLDKARLEVFEKQIEFTKRVRGQSNVVFAWYGTSAKGVESILMHGFGVPNKVSYPGACGIGIYLSHIHSPHNSAMLSEIDENGEKHVVLCRVILGKCEKVEAGSQQMYPSSVEYDTGVDDLENPKWYTVWHSNMNTHILPECVVSYRPANVPGSMNGVRNMNGLIDPSLFVAKLISKLGGSLPPPRIQELHSLCGLYKERKVGKETFFKQLRSVAGDDVLHSTIQELRG